VPDRPGIAARLFTPLAERQIMVDMIIQNASIENVTDLSFTVSKKDVKEASRLVEEAAREIGAKSVEIDDSVAKVSIVGVGYDQPLGRRSQDVCHPLQGGDQHHDDQHLGDQDLLRSPGKIHGTGRDGSP
jgi:aspartokinase